MDHPVSRVLLRQLDEQIELYKNQIPLLVFKDELMNARTMTGTLKAYQEIRSMLSVPAESPVGSPDDDNFIDPATRLSTRSDV